MRGRKRDRAVRMPTRMRARSPPASGDRPDPERPSAIEEGAMLKTTVMLICLLVIATGAEAKKDRNRVVMDFATMYGVDEAFVGANPIRDLVGDELPWRSSAGCTDGSPIADICAYASGVSSSRTAPRCRRRNRARTTRISFAAW